MSLIGLNVSDIIKMSITNMKNPNVNAKSLVAGFIDIQRCDEHVQMGDGALVEVVECRKNDLDRWMLASMKA